MKKTLLALMVMAGSAFAQDPYSANPGAGAGAPGNYPPGAYAAPGQDPYSAGAGAYGAPAVCGPGYMWIDGYTDASGYFVNGYCAVPPFSGAYWVAPGYFGGRYVAGYWGRGGFGYAPRVGFRGGYGGGSRFAGGYANGFRAPAPGVRTQGAVPGLRAPAGGANGFRSQGSYHGGGPAMRGGGSGHGGRR